MLRLSPPGSKDVLIKARIIPKKNSDGTVEFVGDGKKTVDAQQIRDRFNALGIVTDWARFKRIADARNDIEHHYPQLTKKALRGVITDAFLIIRSFIPEELRGNPHELLGEEIWRVMLEVSEVYTEEQAECEKLLQEVDWKSDTLRGGLLELTCEQCGSGLLRPDSPTTLYDEVNLQCRSCGVTESADSFVPRAIAVGLEYDLYYSRKDGGETPYVMCPECAADTYVMNEQRCALCGHEAEHTCIRCGHEIPGEELLSSPLCGYCDHVTHKDE
jgi:hypothetical protein